MEKLSPLWWWLAWLWRRLLVRTTFIAVAGGAGRTTAREALAAILDWLDPELPRSRDGGADEAVRTILRTKPWRRFAIVEAEKETAAEICSLARPQVTVLLNAGPGPDSEQSRPAGVPWSRQVLKALPAGGQVVAEADPEFVEQAARRILGTRRFGFHEGCEVWAEEVSAGWPRKLAFTVHAGRRSRRLHTRFTGERHARPLLAALGAALACGVPFEEAAEGVLAVRPPPARLQELRLPLGAVFLRDEAEGAPEAFQEAFRELKNAAGVRRVAVVSDWDAPGAAATRQELLGRSAAGAADLLVAVGPYSGRLAEAARKAGLKEERVRCFLLPEQAARFLRAELNARDLVLVKGRRRDHLSRLFFAQLGEVECWKTSCALPILCDDCERLGEARERARFSMPVFAP